VLGGVAKLISMMLTLSLRENTSQPTGSKGIDQKTEINANRSCSLSGSRP